MNGRMTGNPECLETGTGNAGRAAFCHFFRFSAFPVIRPSGRPAGFTMIELLVVLAIILIMTGVAVFSLSGAGTPKQQLRREALGLTELFKSARLAAMERKLKVDIYADPSARAVYAVESEYGRERLAAETSFADLEPEPRRFFRTVTFPETIEIEAFALDEIDANPPDEESPFAPVGETAEKPAEKPMSRPVFSFTHLGGATGGGISVARNDLRIDLACDLLTGQPEIVRRRNGP